MRTTALYRNQPDVRAFLEKWILEAIQAGFDFNQHVRSPVFTLRPTWPTHSELLSLPIWMQCEEVEIKDGKLTSIRAVVIDVEAIQVAEKPKILPRNKR